MIPPDDLQQWLQRAADILSANRVAVDGHRYTGPSIDTDDFGRKDYANQFLWDSCFHAIVWRHIDPVMAEDELLSLVSRQVREGPDTGMIPHCNYWRGGGDWLWNHAERSAITQPPLIAVAAWLVHEKSQNLAFLEALYAPLRAYHDWFDRRRDPDHDHLVCVIHPWETGGDALPRWDSAMGFGEFTHERAREARHKLAHTVVEYDTDAAALAAQGLFCVEPMDYNAIRAADMEAMARIARALGQAEEVGWWQQRVEAIRRSFQARMLRGGKPYDLDGVEERPIVQDSAGQFVTLFGGLPTPSQAGALVARLQEPRFWTPFPVSTSPTDAPTFAPDTYWRGNVWPSVNWLIYQGLRRYGYDSLADELARRGLVLLRQSGFWEYYHPITGKGLGGSTFSWATVLLDLVASSGAA